MAVKKVCETSSWSSKKLMEEVQRWSGMKPKGVSLRYMMEFGSTPTHRNLLISAQFLHNQLPIRLARRAMDLHSLPFGLSLKPAVLQLRNIIPERITKDWKSEKSSDILRSDSSNDNNRGSSGGNNSGSDLLNVDEEVSLIPLSRLSHIGRTQPSSHGV